MGICCDRYPASICISAVAATLSSFRENAGTNQIEGLLNIADENLLLNSVEFVSTKQILFPDGNSACSTSLNTYTERTRPDGTASTKDIDLCDRQHSLRSGVLQELGVIFTSCFGESIDLREHLMESGADSLAMIEFQQQLSEVFEISMPGNVLFTHPSLESLAQFITVSKKSDQTGSATNVKELLSNIHTADAYCQSDAQVGTVLHLSVIDGFMLETYPFMNYSFATTTSVSVSWLAVAQSTVFSRLILGSGYKSPCSLGTGYYGVTEISLPPEAALACAERGDLKNSGLRNAVFVTISTV